MVVVGDHFQVLKVPWGYRYGTTYVPTYAESNIGALSKAIPAIEKGMGGAFLQTGSAAVLREISVSANMIPADRDILASFLSEGSNYAPKSGEIVGTLYKVVMLLFVYQCSHNYKCVNYKQII